MSEDPVAHRGHLGRLPTTLVDFLTRKAPLPIRAGSRGRLGAQPAWITPEALSDGSVTGPATPGWDIQPHETRLAGRAGVPANRWALNTYFLTEDGQAALAELLRTGKYRVNHPHEGALLVVTWLVRAGDTSNALTVLDALRPLAHRLPFYPVPAEDAALAPERIYRWSAGDVSRSLAVREPPRQLSRMREATGVWNPFGADVLALWMRAGVPERGGCQLEPGWLSEAEVLLDRYRRIAQDNPTCTKHRNPKENLGILLQALELAVDNGHLDSRETGWVRRACAAMIAKRGDLDEYLRDLAERQDAGKQQPPHHEIARVIASRLAGFPADQGLEQPDRVLGPITQAEAAATRVPVGTPVPPNLRAATRRALAGSIEELIEARLVPSSEVLAGLVPQLAAATAAEPYADPALRQLVAANCRAFRAQKKRTSDDAYRRLRVEELPWVAAVLPHRQASAGPRDLAWATLQQLADLTLEHFPRTGLPNPCVREMASLAREVGLDLPWVQELSPDRFAGNFSCSFADAARIAHDLLTGTLYAKYYGIDSGQIAALHMAPEMPAKPRRHSGNSPAFPACPEFAALCRSRAGVPSDAAQGESAGRILEQAQILTTDNLALLAGPLGVIPRAGWQELAIRAFLRVCCLMGTRTGEALPAVPDAAYAWRHVVFFTSMLGSTSQAATLDRLTALLETCPQPARSRLAPELEGLRDVTRSGL